MRTTSKGRSKIYIAGHTGFVGSAFVCRFSNRDDVALILATHQEVDLIDPSAVASFLMEKKPEIVILAAGKVGGIHTNSKYPADFIYQNLMIETNVIHGAFKAGVKRLLNFGSACIYPKVCAQPMSPELLMTGKIEPTNEPYAIAKLAGLSLCQSYNKQYGTSYITAIPSNLYGPGDTTDLDRAHVVSALLQRFQNAKEAGEKEIILWGSGNSKRDFLYIEDLADACEILLGKYEGNEPVNIGSGRSVSIRDLALAVRNVVGADTEIVWDTSKPDGSPERFLDNSAIHDMGWSPKISLEEGLRQTFLSRQ